MAEPHLEDEEFLRNVLNDKIPVIPKLSDLLPVLWRETPEDVYDPDRPEWRLRLRCLFACIFLAGTEPWAREGLYNLLHHLLEKGEPVPRLLYSWVLYQCITGSPAPRPGRPKKSDRDLRVLTVFTTLSDEGCTREAAMHKIADLMGGSPETVRSIIHKHRRALPRRR